MNLIHFRGLNCYFDCVVSIAASLGLQYEEAFATLWTETELTYDRRLKACSSKRILENLKGMGVRFICLGCASANEANRVLTPCQAGELVIVGMDAYFIPWSPIYQALHDPHYFIARKGESGSFCCFDPTYDKQNEQITREDLTTHAFDICRIEKSTRKPLHIGVKTEAQEVVYSHPETLEKLILKINNCANKKRRNAALLAKYVDALINNRYLFMRYLQNSLSDPAMDQQAFDKDFFARWEAAKNGLYKASLIRDNEGVIEEVCALVTILMKEEMDIAKQLSAISCDQ